MAPRLTSACIYSIPASDSGTKTVLHIYLRSPNFPKLICLKNPLPFMVIFAILFLGNSSHGSGQTKLLTAKVRQDALPQRMPSVDDRASGMPVSGMLVSGMLMERTKNVKVVLLGPADRV